MKRLLYILLLLPAIANAQFVINPYVYTAAAAPTPPATGRLGDWIATTAYLTRSVNVVSQWDDRNANGRNWVQATSGNRPDWNGSDGVIFTGSAPDKMTLAYVPTQSFTCYVIGSVNISASIRDAFFISDDPTYNMTLFVERSGTTNTFYASGQGFGNTFSQGVITNNQVYLFKATWNGASGKVQLNSTATTRNLGTNNPSTNLTIGCPSATTSTTLTIKEILLYDGTHSETDVATYLTATYGVP
jgi:hypothetical protein